MEQADTSCVTRMTDPFARAGLVGYPPCRLLAHTDVMADAVRLELFPAERARLSRLKDETRRASLSASFQARRKIIAELTQADPASVSLSANEAGAPLLSHPRGYAVSIAANESFTLVALETDAAAIGTDLEIMRPIDWRPMLEMICSETEGQAFHTHAQKSDGLEDFLRLWTIKEAILKATGKGFRAGPKNILVPEKLLAPAAYGQIAAFGERYRIWTTSLGHLVLSLARKSG